MALQHATTLSIMTFSIRTRSIMTLFATLSITDAQNNRYQVASAVILSVAFFIVMLSVIMLNVVMLSVIMLSVVAPCEYHSKLHY
jgi:hypothetical protein